MPILDDLLMLHKQAIEATYLERKQGYAAELLMRYPVACGDVLIVAVNSDRTVGELKGSGRPLQTEPERAEILAALAAVDIVTIFDQATPRELIAAMLPDVLVKGGDWPLDQIVGRGEVEAAGGQVVSLPVSPGYSSSQLIETVRERLEGS